MNNTNPTILLGLGPNIDKKVTTHLNSQNVIQTCSLFSRNCYFAYCLWQLEKEKKITSDLV